MWPLGGVDYIAILKQKKKKINLDRSCQGELVKQKKIITLFVSNKFIYSEDMT